jgi:hypothetical protein
MHFPVLEIIVLFLYFAAMAVVRRLFRETE